MAEWVVKPIDDDVREKLNASYRIGNFCQCVTELIYNSIDANATAIAIRTDVDKFTIQVVDKADGISEIDMRVVGEKCFTSKVENKTSIGYKGQVLAALVELSEECLIESTTSASTSTYRKRFANAKFLSFKKSKSDRTCSGTTVTIKKLFYALPVRQNQHKREFVLEQLVETITALAICHSNISFTLRDESSKKVLVGSSRTRNSAKSFQTFFGTSYPHDIEDFGRRKSQRGVYEAHLYFGVSSFRNSSLQFVFVNGRPTFKTRVHRAMIDAATKQGKRNENCVYVLKISCQRTEMDVFESSNSETFLNFKNWAEVEELLFELLKNDAKSRLTQVAQEANVDADLPTHREIVRSEFVKNPNVRLNDEFSLPKEIAESLRDQPQRDVSGTVKFPTLRKNFVNETISSLPRLPLESASLRRKTVQISKNCSKVVDSLRLTKDMLPFLRVINQIDNKFVVCVLKTDDREKNCERYAHALLLFDQHAVSERICLENLYCAHVGETIVNVRLKSPLTVTMDANEIRFVLKFTNKFEKFGLSIESTKKSLAQVKTVPLCLSLKEESDLKNLQTSRLHEDVIELIRQISDSLKSTNGILATSWLPQILRDILNTVACRSAVKFGDPLTVEQCESLVENLKKCKNPFECAHGRPSMVPVADLRRFYSKC